MRPAAAALALALLATPAAAQDLTIQGRVAHPTQLTTTQLRARPQVTIEVAQQTAQAATPTRFTGTLLWPLLAEATPQDEAGSRTALQHTLLARGKDGYAVALSLAELDPDFEGKQVLIAYEMNNTPLPTLRLIVPNDKKAGRSVRDLITIEVR